MSALQKELSAVAVFGADSGNATAGGTGDETAINGTTIDLNAQPMGEVVAFAVGAKAVLAVTKTLTVTGKIQDSADGSTWADVKSFGTLISLLGGSGGTTERGANLMQIDRARLRRYVRSVVTPDLSATGTDTAVIQTVGILGGLQVAPA